MRKGPALRATRFVAILRPSIPPARRNNFLQPRIFARKKGTDVELLRSLHCFLPSARMATSGKGMAIISLLFGQCPLFVFFLEGGNCMNSSTCLLKGSRNWVLKVSFLHVLWHLLFMEVQREFNKGESIFKMPPSPSYLHVT